MRLLILGVVVLAGCTITTDPGVETGGCNSSTGAVELAPGGARVVTGTSVCVPGSTTGAQYALVTLNSAPTGGASSTVTVTGTNIGSISGSLAPPDMLNASLQGLTLPTQRRNDSFHGRLREIESRTLATRIPAARQWLSRSTASGPERVPAAALGVGDPVQLNANTDQACENPELRNGVVMAQGSRSIVVADNNNPAGGYTLADYQSIAAQFDTLIDPLVTSTFGTPSDIDNNGRVVLFFTRAVNELTPAGSEVFIAGFFFARDLFPSTPGALGAGCAGSNDGEMFYLIVPDPAGTINNNTFTKSRIQDGVASLLTHEYQHLVNASRRMYVNTSAEDFEEKWLDEGLSHSAEELLFYRQAGLSPRGNIGLSTLQSSQRIVTAFNNDVAGNFGSLVDFLKNPSTNSPYSETDSIATRGAAWSFLRYAVDRGASSDGTTWFQLTNSIVTGRATLTAVFGPDVAGLFRDWSGSLIADDIAGSDAAYQHRSWQYRALITALANGGGYPLKLTRLSTGVPSTTTVKPGGAVYPVFQAGSVSAQIDWTAGPGTVLTLIGSTRDGWAERRMRGEADEADRADADRAETGQC